MIEGLTAVVLAHAALVSGAATPLPADTTDAPAPPAWQQELAYTVEAELDEDAGVLRAAQTVRYRNASPDTLDRLYFHLYLNAFRPNSVWARNEKRQRLDFQALEEPDYGFERLRSVRLVAGPGAPGGGADAGEGAADGGRGVPGVVTGETGTELTPRYPHAPDSTVVRLDLPGPLAPGETAVLRMRWDARPATLCRRQCREGRSWDFAQWYPRAAVYDWGGWEAHPLYPQGEFYGEFGTYDVTLDLAEDQVVGATGVPVEGDPGWRPEPGSPVDEPLFQRGFYGEGESGRGGDAETGQGAGAAERPTPRPGLLSGGPAEGRKRVRFHAEDVHHFAWSASPEYRYEGGVFRRGDLPDVAIHVLYRPDDADWADGVAVERTIRALSWLQTVFRPYPYPQLTNLHRLEGGGTEFPMVLMNGGVSQGLIVHEGTHQYAHGILANNEWKQAWLDEGLTSFLDTWYAEEHGGDPWAPFMERLGQVEGILADPATRRSPPSGLSGFLVEGDTLPTPLPVDTPSEEFADYAQYGYASYSKPQAIFYMLREMLGKETMRRILRTYYDRYQFRHVNRAALQSTAEDVSGRELGWFFDQWFAGTGTLDYAVGDVSVEERSDGTWRTRVEVLRKGENWMPVAVRAGGETVVVEARDATTTVSVTTDERPGEVVLDPGRVLLDVDRSDNRTSLDGSGG